MVFFRRGRAEYEPESCFRVSNSPSRLSRGLITLLVLTPLLATVKAGSWMDWSWAPEHPKDSCEKIVEYMYNLSYASVDLVKYLGKSKVELDP